MKSGPFRAIDGGVEVDLLVVPNATRAGVVGRHGDRIKVKVSRPPEKGRANGAVEDLLRSATGARRARVIRGRTARHKTLVVYGVTLEAVKRSLTSGF